MTLEQMEQYIALKREEKLWASELDALMQKSGGIVKDVVRGSSDDYPYTAHPVTIAGIQTKPSKRIYMRQVRMEKRRERTAREREEIEAFIDTLQDSQLRQVLYCMYIKDMRWKRSAMQAGITEGAAKMMVRRHFGKA